jgi:hypothetical protein
MRECGGGGAPLLGTLKDRHKKPLSLRELCEEKVDVFTSCMIFATLFLY